MSNPYLLQELEVFSYAVLFIGLIFDLLLIIFVIVSVLLIYSLLQISVETKTFEIGIMRLVGLTRAGFVGMILTQACMFVFPAVILGFAVAPPITYAIFNSLFKNTLDYMPSIWPTGWAIVRGVCIGIFIPLISSIIPIRRTLSGNLTDALNVNRGKLRGVKVSFIDFTSKAVLPYLLFGSVACIYGFVVYYGLPISLLKLNFGLLLRIFFLILMGLLTGITILTSNI